MNLFVNETHIFLTSQQEDIPDQHYDLVWDGREESEFPSAPFEGNVLLKYPSEQLIKQLVTELIEQKSKQLSLLVCLVKGLKKTKSFLMEDFKIIKAAGGLVTKGDQILMIYRLKRWDFPKGKVESGEKRKEAAIREVEEECNVKVELLHKLATTWHHYKLHDKHILKQTKWYLMHCLEDGQMKPQIEEDIEDIKWMNPDELTEAMKNTYNTIKFVFQAYEK